MSLCTPRRPRHRRPGVRRNRSRRRGAGGVRPAAAPGHRRPRPRPRVGLSRNGSRAAPTCRSWGCSTVTRCSSRSSSPRTGCRPGRRSRVSTALLDEAKPEAVASFTSTADHPSVVAAAAKRHVHVMMEKPLAVSLADARRIAGDARARRHPRDRQLRDDVVPEPRRGGGAGAVAAASDRCARWSRWTATRAPGRSTSAPSSSPGSPTRCRTAAAPCSTSAATAST